jgi:hypothetical protein
MAGLLTREVQATAMPLLWSFTKEATKILCSNRSLTNMQFLWNAKQHENIAQQQKH